VLSDALAGQKPDVGPTQCDLYAVERLVELPDKFLALGNRESGRVGVADRSKAGAVRDGAFVADLRVSGIALQLGDRTLQRFLGRLELGNVGGVVIVVSPFLET
jgi:hypothetical protein